MALRKGQRELVEQYRGGFCAVPAIPGGGKTHCLSLWAVEMIANNFHKPGKILIVTYMNSAVNNFKQRISTELSKRGINGSKDYFVSTIHGLCFQILKEKPDLFSANEEFEVADSTSKIHFINMAIDEWKKRNENRFKLFIEESQLSANKVSETYKKWQDRLCGILLSSIGDFKIRGINPKEALDLCSKLGEDSILRCAAEVYEVYDRKLKINGLLDFDDMLYFSKKILAEDEGLLEKYREKYTFVCEDEAQDSNLIQSEILTRIANGNLLRVGDSNQAICGSFSNSDFKLFKEFCDAEETITYNITESSRNTKEIIDLANYFVKFVSENHMVMECRDSLLKQFIEPVAEDDPRKNPAIDEYGVKVAVFPSWDDEASRIAFTASRMMEKHPDKTMAILVPNSWKIGLLLKYLDSRRIPYEELDNASKEKNKTLRALGRVIDFIALPEDQVKLIAMLEECFLKIEYEVGDKKREELDKQIKERTMLFNFLKRFPTEKILYSRGLEIDTSEIPDEILQTSIWQELLSKLHLIRELLEFPAMVVEKLILFISEKLKFDREERAIAQKVASDVRYLMRQNPRWRLSDLSLELLSPKNMFNFFANVVWELKGYEPKPGVVTVCTYHKSKGLEWDIVFLTGINNNDFPVELTDKFTGEYWFLKQEYKNPQALAKSDLQNVLQGNVSIDSIMDSKIESISERARLLYVGITRAKEYLFLSSDESIRGKSKILPSKYLLEIRKFIEEVGNEYRRKV